MGGVLQSIPVPSVGKANEFELGPVDRKLERFVPEELVEKDLRARPRAFLLLRFTLVGAVFTLLFHVYLVSYREAPYAEWLNGLYGLSLLGNPLILRCTRSVSIASHWTLAWAFAVLLIESILLGGVQSLAFPWLASLPVAGMLLSGTRSGVGWTVIATTGILGVGIAETQGWLPGKGGLTPSQQMAQTITVAGLAFGTGCLGSFYETLATCLLVNLERQRRTFKERSVRDFLTGLANRAVLTECLIQSWERCRRRGPRGALFYIDLNGFKAINDQRGHAAGDCVLREIGFRLKNVLRRSDLAGRIGGDEFALIVEGLENHDDAATLANKVGAALEAPIALDSGQAKVGASIGIAFYPDANCEVGTPSEDPVRGVEPSGVLRKVETEAVERLFTHADAAMYRAKREGRRYWIHGVPAPEPSLSIEAQR